MLIIRAIVQLEQKRGVQRDQKGTKKLECSRFSKELPIWSLETAKLRMKNKLEKIMMSDLKGDFDYVSTEHF